MKKLSTRLAELRDFGDSNLFADIVTVLDEFQTETEARLRALEGHAVTAEVPSDIPPFAFAFQSEEEWVGSLRAGGAVGAKHLRTEHTRLRMHLNTLESILRTRNDTKQPMTLLVDEPYQIAAVQEGAIALKHLLRYLERAAHVSEGGH